MEFDYIIITYFVILVVLSSVILTSFKNICLIFLFLLSKN